MSVNIIDSSSAITGDINQTMMILNTGVRCLISFHPTLDIPKPIIAVTFICTNDVGIPSTAEAKSNKLAVKRDIKVAPSGPKLMMFLPVVSMIFDPNKELPIAKFGAISSVDRSIIIRYPLSLFLIPNEFAVMEMIGPAAFATLFDPMEKATKQLVTITNTFKILVCEIWPNINFHFLTNG